jgi:hypothetical protein
LHLLLWLVVQLREMPNGIPDSEPSLTRIGKSLTVPGRLRGMLQGMQQQPRPSPTSGASSFAGLLAALTAPASAAQDRAPFGDDDGLEDDVATLSYERALRTHARYRPSDTIPSDASDYSLTNAPTQRPIGVRQAISPAVNPVQEPATLAPVAPAGSATSSEAGQVHSSEFDRNLKSASITIRMSHEECAQLRKRAADAGLTVSAYLRSCTFEAESLRAQVKDALAQLRAGESTGKAPYDASNLPRDIAPVKRSWLHWPSRA